MSGDQLNLDAIADNITRAGLAQEALGKGLPVTASRLLRLAGALDDADALVAEVRRLRAALEVIAGDDLDYLGRLRLTDAENAIYVIARDALGRKV